MALMQTILPLPMFSIFGVFLQCNSKLYMREFTCYSGDHLANLPAAFVGAVLLGIFCASSHLFITDSNPNSLFPLS